MVARTLTDQMIRSGAELVRELDETKLSPDAALWLYLPDVGEWKLLLVEVKLSELGPRPFYEQIQRTLAAAKPELAELPLDSVGLTTPDNPLVLLLSSAIRTGPGISGIRFTNNVINGTVIEDAYIYRLATRQRPSSVAPAPGAKSAGK